MAFPDTATALPSILRGEVRCTVVAVDVASIDTSLTTLRVFQHAVPTHAVVAWCDRRTLTTRQLLDVAQAGVAELVLRDIDDIRHVLGRILNSATQRSFALSVEQRVGADLPRAIRPVFRFLLENVHQSLDVDQVSAAFGITRQTLRNRLIGHRMPLPRAFMTWSRLLVAGSLLQERGQTLDTVAWQLDFSSGHHLGTALRRYTGLGIEELRVTGVASGVESAFRSALAAARSGSLPAHSAGD
ncbi:MAG TPA: AraC family transcriptional regulator [Gemmatimonas sp.]|nr:AraC family transcriptional regulator [Gemmatimonas sp.]